MPTNIRLTCKMLLLPIALSLGGCDFKLDHLQAALKTDQQKHGYILSADCQRDALASMQGDVYSEPKTVETARLCSFATPEAALPSDLGQAVTVDQACAAGLARLIDFRATEGMGDLSVGELNHWLRRCGPPGQLVAQRAALGASATLPALSSAAQPAASASSTP